ncbi:helix-turn-helix domain-containing protein [Williamsia limnetica]|uniref:helix-turn-helix domain-containing protein n=1 Tax=Williamsia limnetica TaxID=882452 RepID=UPI0013148330|nr:helix-turn-helix domain-containing protein [Williamsia limnetica]
MHSDAAITAARLSVVENGDLGRWADQVSPEIADSWLRCVDNGHQGNRLDKQLSFVGDIPGAPLTRVARAVVTQWSATAGPIPASILAIDAHAVVRCRHDGTSAVAAILDTWPVAEGFSITEREFGTSAGTLALSLGRPALVSGPEHFHPDLVGLHESAAPVIDDAGAVIGAIVLVSDQPVAEFAAAVTRTLAAQVGADLIAGPSTALSATSARLAARVHGTGTFAIGAAGDHTIFDPRANALDGSDSAVLTEAVRAALVDCRFEPTSLTLPSGSPVEVEYESVEVAGDVVGCVLVGTWTKSPASQYSSAMARQGAHVAPVGPRDYTAGMPLVGAAGGELGRSRNKALLTPMTSTRSELALSIGEHSNRLLTGEKGVGKRTLAVAEFKAQHPDGVIHPVDCSVLDTGRGDSRWGDTQPLASVVHSSSTASELVLLSSLNSLDAMGARQVDAVLRSLATRATSPLVIGCVDATTVDRTRPYAMLSRHFHGVTRIPSLRYRPDDIADLCRSILKTISPRHSLRLSLSVIRVLEGYSWPGNIDELVDVLGYVVAHKPFGEITVRDLPATYFRSAPRKLTPLEVAQCETIIHALYEVNGNRYKAAALLGIGRSSLYRKIDSFGISYIG